MRLVAGCVFHHHLPAPAARRLGQRRNSLGHFEPGKAYKSQQAVMPVWSIAGQPSAITPTRHESASFAKLIASAIQMKTPSETHEVEIITRFLLRFADLMSTGSNADNLLRAAQLLEANVNRATDAEQQLLKERSNGAHLQAQLAALSRDDHVQVPVSILRLAAAQFESLAAAFEKSGNLVSQAMCSASASTLERVLEGKASRDKAPVVLHTADRR